MMNPMMVIPLVPRTMVMQVLIQKSSVFQTWLSQLTVTVGNKYWSLVLEDATGVPFASFVVKKSQVKDHIVPLTHLLQNKEKTMKYPM